MVEDTIEALFLEIAEVLSSRLCYTIDSCFTEYWIFYNLDSLNEDVENTLKVKW